MASHIERRKFLATLRDAAAAWPLAAIVELLRVRQCGKNSFVLARLFFSSQRVSVAAVTRAASAFFVFCLISSAVYIFNDYCDIEADRQHAKKRLRPLPSGRVPVRVALT